MLDEAVYREMVDNYPPVELFKYILKIGKKYSVPRLLPVDGRAFSMVPQEICHAQPLPRPARRAALSPR